MEKTTLIQIEPKKLAELILKYGPISLSVDAGKGIEYYQVCAVDIRPNVATPVAAIDIEGKRKWCVSAAIAVQTRYTVWSKKEAIQIFNNKNCVFRLKGTNIPLKIVIDKNTKINQYLSDSYLEVMSRDMEYSIEPKKWAACGGEVKHEEYNIEEEVTNHLKMMVEENK